MTKVKKSLKLRLWEKNILRVLAIASSLYLGLVFIGVISVHCDAYNPPAPTQAQLEAARQAELYAASSKAIEQVFCNVVLIITGTTGKVIGCVIPLGILLGSGLQSFIKKMRRRNRKPNEHA